MTGSQRLVVCAKSPWDPPMRREHGLATAAAERGYHVDFIERATDVRDLPSILRRSRPTPPATAPAGIRVLPRFTPVPGHRHPLAARVDGAGLGRLLRRVLQTGAAPDAVVVNAPWNWVASGVAPAGTRRVLDLGDDWATLLPQRAERVHQDYRRIAAEADAIIVVAPALAELFDREVVVIPNAVAPELLLQPVAPPPGAQRMTYVGTLSERFDSTLMAEVLRLLPEWTLELYGPCHYSGRGSDPGPELQALLAEFPGRVRWHGVVDRVHLGAVLDQGDVLVLPNDPTISQGQDSMKLYDYAARGRPIVATPIRVPTDGPSVLALAAESTGFAEAVQRLAGADGTHNRAWAEANAWSSRLPPWLAAVTGASV